MLLRIFSTFVMAFAAFGLFACFMSKPGENTSAYLIAMSILFSGGLIGLAIGSRREPPAGKP